MFKKRKSLENIDISRLLVRQAGIEPAAFTFGVCYSIPWATGADKHIIYLYHKSIRLERVFYRKPGEPCSSERRPPFLQKMKVIFMILYQTVLFHAAQLSRHGASVHTEKISEFLTVKGNVKAAVFRYLSMIWKIRENFFPGSPSWQDVDLSVK